MKNTEAKWHKTAETLTQTAKKTAKSHKPKDRFHTNKTKNANCRDTNTNCIKIAKTHKPKDLFQHKQKQKIQTANIDTKSNYKQTQNQTA